MQNYDTALKDELFEVATAVRSWAVRQAKADNSPFINCNNLRGMCARASAKLFRVLSRRGHRCTLVVADISSWSCHAYVTVGDFIVDVTATQFGETPVVVIPKGSGRAHTHFWERARKHFRTTDYKEFVKEVNDWEYDQRRDI